MILRKPYALFIKYFKLLHVIMAVLILILLLRTFTLYRFFNTYLTSPEQALAAFTPESVLNIYSFLLAMFIVIVTIALLSVMIYKKKPKFLYIYNIVIYVLVVVLYGFCYSGLINISNVMLDVRVTKAYQDFAFIALFLQGISFVLVALRATGFDIKQFNFTSDLQQLDISEKDSEEIEVSLEVDKGKAIRDVKRRMRHAKYVYFENKFIINTIGIICLVVLAFWIYFNVGIYSANYSQGTTFTASGVDFNVKNSYITNNDINGSQVVSDDDTLVVVKFDVRTNGSETLNTGLITLKIGNLTYGQNKEAAKRLYDLGTPYNKEELKDEFESYIIVFEIPKSLVNEKMELKVNDDLSYVKGQVGAKNNYVKLKPEKFGNGETVAEANLGEDLDFYGSILGSTSLDIDSFEIADRFKVSYLFCYANDKCNNSYEYVTPTASGNYDKTLMKFVGTLNVDETVNIPDLNSFRNVMNSYGTIHYKVGDVWKSEKIESSNVKPSSTVEANTYYIEVPSETKNASEIYLTFDIRGSIYKYNLK